jgi:hypothetical protein
LPSSPVPYNPSPPTKYDYNYNLPSPPPPIPPSPKYHYEDYPSPPPPTKTNYLPMPEFDFGKPTKRKKSFIDSYNRHLWEFPILEPKAILAGGWF